MGKRLRNVPKRSAPPGTTTAQHMDHHKRRSCLRKRQLTALEVERAERASARRKGTRLRGYQCRFCGYWHMTSQSKRKDAEA